MDFAAIKARLQARVPSLRQIEDALSLTALLKSGALPRQSPAAFVLPAGIVGGQTEAMSGAFVQSVQDVISIVLAVNASSAAGVGQAARVDILIREIIDALCGWAPETGPGVYALRRAEVMSMTGGLATWRIDLAIADQLRIQSS